MPGVQRTLGADGQTPAPWAAMQGQINSIANVAAGAATQTTRYALDQYQNCAFITGALNQIVTVGAGFFTSTGTASTTSLNITLASAVGVEEGMKVTNATGTFAANTTVTAVNGSTITLSEYPLASGSVSVTCGPGGGVQVGTGLTGFGACSPSNFAHASIATTQGSTGATITGAVGTFTNSYQIGAVDANTGAAVITPGTSYTISGSVVTLSAPALLTETAAYCCSVLWTPSGGTVHP